MLGLCCLFLLFLPANPGEAQTSPPVFAIPESWLAGGFNTSGWPTFGYNTEHVADYPGAFPSLKGRVVWQQSTGGSVFSAPIVANGTVYVGSTGGNLLALDAGTGAIRWRHAIGQFLNDATPVVVGWVVFVGANRTWVYALDAEDGHQLWAANLQEVIKAAPTYSDGMVLVNSSNSATALDARTGVVRWRFHEVGFGWPTTASPTIDGQVAYVALGDKTVVYAFNVLTGQQLWAYNAGDRLVATPLVVRREVIIGTWKGTIDAVDAGSGRQLWRYNVNEVLPHGVKGDGIAGSFASNNGTIFVGTYDGNMVALDAATGMLRWSRLLTAPILGTPVSEGTSVYVSGGEVLYALEASSGRVLWHLDVGDARSEPALSGERLYIATVQGYIDAIA